jgi:hypothetical protein
MKAMITQTEDEDEQEDFFPVGANFFFLDDPGLILGTDNHQS